MSQFIGYQINEDSTAAVPVATADNYDSCFRQMIARTIGVGVSQGSVQGQQRDDVPVEDFALLTKVLDEAFADIPGAA